MALPVAGATPRRSAKKMSIALQIVAIAWIIQAVIGSLLSAPIVLLFWKRAHWTRETLLAFVIPFSVWLILHLTPLSSGKKSLSNVFVEPFYIGIAIAVMAVVNAMIGSRFRYNYVLKLQLLCLCLAAIGVFFFTPALPE